MARSAELEVDVTVEGNPYGSYITPMHPGSRGGNNGGYGGNTIRIQAGHEWHIDGTVESNVSGIVFCSENV